MKRAFVLQDLRFVLKILLRRRLYSASADGGLAKPFSRWSLDSGMNARDDESQLTFAAAQGRVLVSYNARDFGLLHCNWLENGRSHSGILIIPQQRYSTGEIVRRMLRLSSIDYRLAGRICYLSNF